MVEGRNERKPAPGQAQGTHALLWLVLRQPQSRQLQGCRRTQDDAEHGWVGVAAADSASQRKINDGKAFTGNEDDEPCRGKASTVSHKIESFARRVVAVEKAANVQLAQGDVHEVQEDEDNVEAVCEGQDGERDAVASMHGLGAAKDEKKENVADETEETDEEDDRDEDFDCGVQGLHLAPVCEQPRGKIEEEKGVVERSIGWGGCHGENGQWKRRLRKHRIRKETEGVLEEERANRSREPIRERLDVTREEDKITCWDLACSTDPWNCVRPRG